MTSPVEAPPARARSSSEPAAPAFAAAWAAFVYLIGTMLLGYPALAGQFLVNARSDQYMAGYAFRQFAAQSLKSGHGFPQWNPFLQGGLPYIAAMHGDIFYPTFLLRMLMPTDVAMTWEFIIHLFLCGMMTYVFLRVWKFSFWAALLGGLAYMMGGSIAGLASPGHDGKLFVSALLPVVLLFVTYGVRDGRRWAWGALALAIGLTFLTPHPQLFQYTLMVSGAFALFVAFTNNDGFGKLSPSIAIRRIAYALGSVILGCVMGAIQYWPALVEYKPWSPRAGGHDWATATSFSFPIEETINSYWPQFSGILDNYWGRNGLHFHSDYFGVVVLLLMGAAFGMRDRISFRRFWTWTGAITLLWAFGGNTPFYHLPFALVPYTKYLRAPSTMIFATSFAVAVLAAIGVERISKRLVSPKYPLIWIGAGAAIAIIASIGGYQAIAGMVANSIAASVGAPADELLQRIGANNSDAMLGAWRSLVFLALSAGVLWGFLTRKLEVRIALASLLVLMAVDLWSIERLYWLFMPPASVTFADDGAIDAINADIAKTGQPGRVLNIPIGPVQAILGRQDRTFSGDLLMIHGIRVPGGYHGNELGMYQNLLSLDSGSVMLSPGFWHHENVQYFYTAAPDSIMPQVAAQLKVPPFVKLAGPVKDAVGTMVSAYRIGQDNPFAFVTNALVSLPPDQAEVTVVDPRFDPASVAIVDTSARQIQTAALTSLPPASGTHARVTAYGPGMADLTLDAAATAGQGLVITENYFPGWQATVDGKPVQVGRMDYNLVGIALPAGAKNVQFRFIDAAYEKGKPVTLVAGLLALILLGVGIATDRRSPTSVSAA